MNGNYSCTKAVAAGRRFVETGLQHGNRLRGHGSIGYRIGNRLVVSLIDIHNSATDDASRGFRVDVHWKSKPTDIRVILNGIDLLDEQRWRLDRPTFGSHQASG